MKRLTNTVGGGAVGSWLAATIGMGALMLGPNAVSAMARQTDTTPGAPSGYRVHESGDPAPTPELAAQPAAPDSSINPAATDAAAAGPVRLARFSFITGNVTWRPSDSEDWSTAAVNQPLRQGSQIWATGDGKAEIQFDDGSLLRLGPGAVVTLQTLYSDADGEFTELRMNQGLVSMHLMQAKSIYQIDAPNVSAKAVGPARLRVGIDSDTEVAVQQGSVTIEGAQGKIKLATGSYVDVADDSSPFDVTGLPPGDTWDQFNADRDRIMDPARNGKYVPSSVALVAGDLSDSGTWRHDPQYGDVWCPTVSQADWTPYHYGHWVWVEPFGWTWVSDESWGWAPYHYGTWVHASYGWGWCPGPAVQYWSPAVVHFSNYGGNVCWVPLSRNEVRYPSVLDIGYRHGNWSLFFSIGGAAVYAPGGSNYFEPRPWHNGFVNRSVFVDNVYSRPALASRVDDRFHVVPVNTRFGGAVQVRETDFGHGGGHFTTVSAAVSVNIFAHGHDVVAVEGGRPFAGPVNVHPGPHAFAATRVFVDRAVGPREVLTRPVFRDAVRPEIDRSSVHQGTFVAPSARPPFGAASGRSNAFRPADDAARARASVAFGPRDTPTRGGDQGGRPFSSGSSHPGGAFTPASGGSTTPGASATSRRSASSYHVDSSHSFHPFSSHNSGGDHGGDHASDHGGDHGNDHGGDHH